MKFRYDGAGERVFPTVGVTVQPGDVFDGPDDFQHVDVTPVVDKKPIKSASSDATEGE